MGFRLALFRTLNIRETVGSFDSLKKFPCTFDPVSRIYRRRPCIVKRRAPGSIFLIIFQGHGRRIILESSTQGEILDHLSMTFFENAMDFVHNSRTPRVLDQLVPVLRRSTPIDREFGGKTSACVSYSTGLQDLKRKLGNLLCGWRYRLDRSFSSFR
jgi:hypothetical protein